MLDEAFCEKELKKGGGSGESRTKLHVPGCGLKGLTCGSLQTSALEIPISLVTEEQDAQDAAEILLCTNEPVLASAARCSSKDSLHQQIRPAICSIMKQFEAAALQKLDELIQKTCASLAVRGSAENSLSTQVNERLLQSLHLEALSTDNLKTVMSLSAELHGQERCRNLKENHGFASSGLGPKTQCAHNLIGGRMLRGNNSKYVMTSRECERETAALALYVTETLGTIDQRDEFFDILWPPASDESLLNRQRSTACSGTVSGRRQTARPVEAVWCTRPKTLDEPAAEVEVAAAAEAAAEFLNINAGRRNSSSFGLTRGGKRTREGNLKNVTSFSDDYKHVGAGPGSNTGRDNLAHPRYSCLHPDVLHLARKRLAEFVPTLASPNPRGGANDAVAEKPPSVQQLPILKRRCARPSSVKRGEGISFVLRADLEAPTPSSFNSPEEPPHDTALSSYRSLKGYKRDDGEAPKLDSCVACAEGPPTSVYGSPPLAPGSSVCESMSALCRSPVKGVYYDSFKKLWRAQWHATSESEGLAVEGKRISRSFSCSRLGYDLARAMAVAWMLSRGRVGEATMPRISGAGSPGQSLDFSSVWAALAAASRWEQVNDSQLKEFMVFHDPKRFLSKIEEFYLSRKVSKPRRPPTFPCQLLSTNNDENGSRNQLDTAANARRRDAAFAKTLGPASGFGGSAGVPREASAERKQIFEASPSDKRAIFLPMSLDDMLEVVWGSPRLAVESILSPKSNITPVAGSNCKNCSVSA